MVQVAHLGYVALRPDPRHFSARWAFHDGSFRILPGSFSLYCLFLGKWVCAEFLLCTDIRDRHQVAEQVLTDEQGQTRTIR